MRWEIAWTRPGYGEKFEHWSIHRKPPAFEEWNRTEMLETGQKVVDLLAPCCSWRQDHCSACAGVGKTVLIQEMINRIAASVVRRCSPGERTREG